MPTPSSFAFEKGVGFLIAEVGSYTVLQSVFDLRG